MAEPVPSDEREEEPSNYGTLQPGTRLGRYQLLVPIARGGMARVWAARLHGQRGFQKLVAVKVILPHLVEEPEFERMFLDEARIASGVHHSNVCEIYELGEENNILYLAMEWISGDSLARVLRAGGKTEAIDPRVAARILADVSAGVHAAHELTDDDGRSLGVVHRDVSPHNILITADGTSKVCDFGVAKALGQLHDATNVGQLKGKLAYMAPEQVTGAPIDRRSDVFSLGCVLYEATTGQRPFRGEGDHQVMRAVLQGEVAPPTTMMRGYPPSLEAIVMRALAPEPILRFPTAERMRLALEEFLARGQLVTQANVAQLVRARIGDSIDRRKERIRRASAIDADSRPGDGLVTPSGPLLQRSGVQISTAGFSSTPPPVQPRESSAPSGASQPGISQPSSALAVDSRSGSFLPPPLDLQPPYMGGSPANSPPPSLPQWSSNVGPNPPVAQYAIAIGIGVLLAVLIGSGVFVWRRDRPAVISEAAPLLEPVRESVHDVRPMRTATSSDIELRLLPADAMIEVDGEAMSSARSVLRPPAGTTTSVVVRAPGYQETKIVLDSATTSPVDVSLRAISQGATGGRDVATNPVHEDAKGSPKDPQKRVIHSPPVAPKDSNPLPANPY